MLNLRTSENRDNTERPKVMRKFCYLSDKIGAKRVTVDSASAKRCNGWGNL